MRHRPEIDGLRALAIAPVVAFHAGMPGLSGGFVGVDVFFVISGFLITSIVAAERDAHRFSFGAFFERRARRILPALFVVMLATLPLAWMWLPPDDLRVHAQSLVAISTRPRSSSRCSMRGAWASRSSSTSSFRSCWRCCGASGAHRPRWHCR
jgi:peptidoglycan/LPS O-acetylase OafA/YrhL